MELLRARHGVVAKRAPPCHAIRHARGVRPKTSLYETKSATPLDRALADVATGQHGVVALSQLVELGLSPAGVRTRVARGRLHRVHHGVYAVGHPILKWEGHLIAAVLACGPRAVLSHRAAAGHLGLMPPGARPIDVTVATGAGRSRP